VLLGAASAAVLLVTVPIGLFTRVRLDRAVSLGFYGLGSFLVLIGFLGGSRGPFRVDQDFGSESVLRPDRRLRRATLDELQEAINSAAVVVAIGLVLLAFGVIIDSRYRLF
jgi:hypothetical protein